MTVSRRRPRRRPALVGGGIVLAATLALTGCGPPPPGTSTVINPSEVPYDLLATEAPSERPHQDVPVAPDTPNVWFVHDGTLVPTEITPAPIGTPTQQARLLLDRLITGPTSTQRGNGLSSALLPGLNLELRSVNAGTAQVTLELKSGSAPDATEGSLALGQVVSTLTSVAGIDAVVFDDGTTPIEVPLPGGALTADPVTAADYATLRS